MPRRLLVVEQRMILRGKGLMLTPGIILSAGQRIQAGDSVVLNRPDGSSLVATIQGTSSAIERGSSNQLFLMLDLLDKNQAPIGTEVWSIGT